MKSRFNVCYATRDGQVAWLHVYTTGEGSVRDHNHVMEMINAFVRGGRDNVDKVVEHEPDDGWTILYEVFIEVADTRRGVSTYSHVDFRMHDCCPHDVAVAGHEIYAQIKHIMRGLRRTKKRKL